jgi:hypothetical protein
VAVVIAQLDRRSPPGLILEIDVGELLPGAVDYAGYRECEII